MGGKTNTFAIIIVVAVIIFLFLSFLHQRNIIIGPPLWPSPSPSPTLTPSPTPYYSAVMFGPNVTLMRGHNYTIDWEVTCWFVHGWHNNRWELLENVWPYVFTSASIASSYVLGVPTSYESFHNVFTSSVIPDVSGSSVLPFGQTVIMKVQVAVSQSAALGLTTFRVRTAGGLNDLNQSAVISDYPWFVTIVDG